MGAHAIECNIYISPKNVGFDVRWVRFQKDHPVLNGIVCHVLTAVGGSFVAETRAEEKAGE